MLCYVCAKLDLLNEIDHYYVTGEKTFIMVNQIVSRGWSTCNCFVAYIC